MMKSILLACFVAGALFAAGAKTPPAAVSIWPVDSLVQVFQDDPPGRNRVPDASYVLAPRNGHATVQLAVQAQTRLDAVSVTVDIAGRIGTEVRRVGYVPVHTDPQDTPASELVRRAPAVFPDPLLEESSFTLEAGRTTPIWITITVPPDTAAGVYNGTAHFRSGARRLADMPFRVRVANAMVPRQQTLRVTNWFYLSPEDVGRYYDLKDNPDRYWQVLSNIGRVLADHHQNVILTPVYDLTDAHVADGALAYDFSPLDRWVETFRNAGTAQMIEGGHLLTRQNGYTSPLSIPIFAIEGDQARRTGVSPGDPRAEAFLRSFLPALYAHLKEKNWLDDYAQHVLDEAHGAEVPVYARYSEIVRQEMPGVLTIDAIDHPSPLLAKNCDIWVPQLGTFDKDMDAIHAHVAQGGQAWFYTCLMPRGHYLNRFIDFPLLKTRLLQWFNFRYGFNGFLHWGGDSWGSNPFGNPEVTIGDGPKTVGLPAGDAFITYPWREQNSIHSSIRLEAMREGIEDYELLNVLQQRDAAKANVLAQRAVSGMTEYVRDVPTFRALQAQLLDAFNGPIMDDSAPPVSTVPARTGPGPLRVLPGNPRWFTDGSGRAVYLAGSHTWNDFIDTGHRRIEQNGQPPAFDYAGFLDVLGRHHDNFFRLWRQEVPQFSDEDPPGLKHAEPMPWIRAGPELAADGKPKFDLTRFNPAYFERMRSRVMAAGERGMYVSVMLFEGWFVQFLPDAWTYHPFNPANNVNGIDGGKLRYYTLDDSDMGKRVLALQEAYMRKVVETVGDLDNVLYEVCNEAGPYSTAWQYHVIRYVKQVEAQRPKQHPVGMTFQYPGGTNDALFNSPADWVSPNNGEPETNYLSNPPSTYAGKVVVSDTDHLLGHTGGDSIWVWKTFLRGLNVLFMEEMTPSPTWQDSAREGMRQTRLWSEKVDLAHMTPHDTLASGRYCLAQPGVEYLALQPEAAEFTVDLTGAPGEFAVEWLDVNTGREIPGKSVEGGRKVRFIPPFGGPAVVHLKRR